MLTATGVSLQSGGSTMVNKHGDNKVVVLTKLPERFFHNTKTNSSLRDHSFTNVWSFRDAFSLQDTPHLVYYSVNVQRTWLGDQKSPLEKRAIYIIYLYILRLMQNLGGRVIGEHSPLAEVHFIKHLCLERAWGECCTY